MTIRSKLLQTGGTRGGSATFNSPGNWQAPPRLVSVTVAGRGGLGASGNFGTGGSAGVGNPGNNGVGNDGNAGYGGGGGGGGGGGCGRRLPLAPIVGSRGYVGNGGDEPGALPNAYGGSGGVTDGGNSTNCTAAS